MYKYKPDHTTCQYCGTRLALGSVRVCWGCGSRKRMGTNRPGKCSYCSGTGINPNYTPSGSRFGGSDRCFYCDGTGQG